jgi:hypothetical protein
MKHSITSLVFTLMVLLTFSTTSKAAQPASGDDANAASKASPNTTWTLIYSDSTIKIYYTDIVCESNNAVRLKVENLTSSAVSFTYKIWTSSPLPKTASLLANQTLEGICATAYANLLVETIPSGSSLNNINVQVTY